MQHLAPHVHNSPEKLWEMLIQGQCGCVEMPADRWNTDHFYSEWKGMTLQQQQVFPCTIYQLLCIIVIFPASGGLTF